MNNSLYKLLKNHGLSDEDICSIESLNPTIYELDDLLNWLESGHSFKEHPFDYCNQFKGQLYRSIKVILSRIFWGG